MRWGKCIAQQLSLGREVAIKRIAENLVDEPGMMERFEREAKLIAALDDANIINVYDFGLFPDHNGIGQVLLVMELISGGMSLKQVLDPEQPPAWLLATALMWQVARGLRVAHEHGVIHRDIKPENILLSNKGIAKLADFGLARATESTALTAHGNMLGTPNYMSPEACHGDEVGAAGDMYSFGATWYMILTGRTVFSYNNLMALVRAHCEEAPTPIRELVPGFPEELADLLMFCLAKKPEQRPTAATIQTQIQRILGAELPHDVRPMIDQCIQRTSQDDYSTTVPTATDRYAVTVPQRMLRRRRLRFRRRWHLPQQQRLRLVRLQDVLGYC